MNGKGRPLPRRLGTLEEAARERAAREVRHALGHVSDAQFALFVMAQQGDDTSPEADEAEAAVLAALDEAWPLVLKAIDYHEDMSEAEANRRMFEAIVEPTIYTRKTGVIRALQHRARETNQQPTERKNDSYD